MSKEQYDQAAVRHYGDARSLARDGRYDGAGHLIGFAAECAIKHAVTRVRPSVDAPYRHLPGLIEAAKKAMHGTRHRSMLEVLNHASFFRDWSVDGRYHADGSVTRDQYASWEQHARRALAAANVRGGSDV